MFKNLNNLVAICDYFRSRNCDLRAALLSCNCFCWVLGLFLNYTKIYVPCEHSMKSCSFSLFFSPFSDNKKICVPTQWSIAWLSGLSADWTFCASPCSSEQKRDQNQKSTKRRWKNIYFFKSLFEVRIVYSAKSTVDQVTITLLQQKSLLFSK